MSRRRRRERPTTPDEQARLRAFVQMADAALNAPPDMRTQALRRLIRTADMVCDPGGA